MSSALKWVMMALALIVFASLNDDVEAVEMRLCGQKLQVWLGIVCTWDGENSPCFNTRQNGWRHENSDEFESTRRRLSRSVTNKCCLDRCEPETYLSQFCCTEREAREYYRMAKIINDREAERIRLEQKEALSAAKAE